jgi:hypothetical protein
MYFVALGITHNEADAEDVMQNVSVTLANWVPKDIDEPVRNPEAFVARCVRNEALDCVRRRRLDVLSAIQSEPSAPVEIDQTEGAERLERVYRAMDLLSREDRAIIEAVIAVAQRDIDRPWSELAQHIRDALIRLSATEPDPPRVEALKTRLFRARERLDLLVNLLTLRDDPGPDILGYFNRLLWQGDFDLPTLRTARRRVAELPEAASRSLASFIALDDQLHTAYSGTKPDERTMLAARLIEPDADKQEDALYRKHEPRMCRKNETAASIEPRLDIHTLRSRLFDAHRTLLHLHLA